MAASQRRPHVLLGVTGSVAAVKWEELALALSAWADVRVVHTPGAAPFVALCERYAPDAHSAWVSAAGHAARAHALLPPPDAPLGVLCDAAEWASYAAVGADPVVHIELRKWADVLLVAPCSANTLAKLAGGLADNLLTCVARAWEFSACGGGGAGVEGEEPSDLRVAKPLLVAPAMNTAMWVHPVTAAHLRVLRGWGCTIVAPVAKRLACGDVGEGALASIDDLVSAVKAACAARGL